LCVIENPRLKPRALRDGAAIANKKLWSSI
jgi:hypothetical protein